MNKNILILLSVALLISGCNQDLNVNTNTESPTQSSVDVSQASDSSPIVPPTPSPSSSPSPSFSTDCWNNHIKTTGSSYDDPNKFYYACYGYLDGKQKGIWLGFYENGDVYYGGSGPNVIDAAQTQLNSADCSNYQWNLNSVKYGYASDATLDHEGYLLSITLANWVSAQNQYEPQVQYTCHIAQ